MRILVSNDDGYDAPGIRALAEAVAPLGDVWVVAPDSEQSAKSHSLTLLSPLRARRRATKGFAVNGTPADCIYLGNHELLDGPPDLVLSGINRGSNLGRDVHYSGTVAAAREACMAGVPAVAISLHVQHDADTFYWETASQVAVQVAQMVAAHGLPSGTLLNVNVPNVPPGQLKGLRTATLGVRRYDDRVTRREDPWGRNYYWIGGAHLDFADIPGSDGPMIEQGYATITPLHSDPTLHSFLDELHERIGT